LRPQSIIRFEQIFLGSAALGALNQVVTFGGFSGLGVAISGGLGAVALAWGVTILLWYLIARRASNVAKWAFVVLIALGVLVAIPNLAALIGTSPRFVVLAILVMLMKIASVILLFRRDAAEWLRSRGQVGVIDVTTFN